MFEFELFVFMGFLAFVSLLFHFFLMWVRPIKTRFLPPVQDQSDRVLIVTAHPDDECMFFSPTILSLQRQGYQIYILCLSRGNYMGGGNIREREIINSCRILGISEGHCTVLDHPNLPDDPKVWWDEALVSKFILQYVFRTKPCMVLSFDEYGVSRHVNHRAIGLVIRDLVQWGKFAPHINVYELESVSLVRKYTSFLDLFMSYIQSPIVLVASFWDVIRGMFAMAAHRSQFVWFRVLYIFTSRYMIVNTLRPVILDPAFDLKYRKVLEERKRLMGDSDEGQSST